MKDVLMVLALCALAPRAEGHARLLDPPGRSSAWRFGFNNPKNVDDNQLNCGGAGVQWASHGGKCGLCGDPYATATPRENEDGGKYGNGIITKTYNEAQWIDIVIDVTANHRGWFETRVCSLDVGGETEACFDQHLLEVDTGGTRWMLPEGIKLFTYKVKLPDNLSCTRCSLQWKWHCGNNWGIDPVTGQGCVGCAPQQEQFWGCSDVAIVADSAAPTTNIPLPTPPRPVTITPAEPTTTSPAPMTTTPAPMTTTPAPMTTTPAPMTTTPAPMTTTPAPMTTTPAPMTTTPVPMTTTPAPMTTTPETMTPTPMTTTPKPMTPPEPMTTTPKPMTPEPMTPKPLTNTPEPMTTTPKPMTPEPMTPKPLTNTPKPMTPEPQTNTPEPMTTAPNPTTTTPMPTTTTPKPVVTSTARPSMAPTTTSAPAVSRTNAPITQQPTQPPRGNPFEKCRSAGIYAGLASSASITIWCQQNCPRNYCPPSHCRCD